jgi:hypothetical protein
MDEIVTSVQRVTSIISEISAASNEQTSGIEQVNDAVEQMDQMTQQNAALVEEAAAAAESMQHQAEGSVRPWLSSKWTARLGPMCMRSLSCKRLALSVAAPTAPRMSRGWRSVRSSTLRPPRLGRQQVPRINKYFAPGGSGLMLEPLFFG